MRNIADIYVSRFCIYEPFIDLVKGLNNIQNSVLAFHMEILLRNKFQGIFPTFMLASLVIPIDLAPGV